TGYRKWLVDFGRWYNYGAVPRCPVSAAYDFPLLHPFKPYVLPVKNETARIDHPRGVHRDGDAFCSSLDRPSAGILKAVFPFELQCVRAGDFRLTIALGRGAVPIDISGIEGDLDRIS